MTGTFNGNLRLAVPSWRKTEALCGMACLTCKLPFTLNRLLHVFTKTGLFFRWQRSIKLNMSTLFITAVVFNPRPHSLCEIVSFSFICLRLIFLPILWKMCLLQSDVLQSWRHLGCKFPTWRPREENSKSRTQSNISSSVSCCPPKRRSVKHFFFKKGMFKCSNQSAHRTPKGPKLKGAPETKWAR